MDSVQVKNQLLNKIMAENRTRMEKSENITWHNSQISAEGRAILQRQNAATIWLTGLSASGKSTLAYEFERLLHHSGYASFVLDGDNIRHGLSADLGFSPENRKENIRRVAEVAKLFNDAGLVVITAFISPYREDRALARRIVGPERFVETYLAADIATCERRDPRGLYRKARAGEIRNFTGITSPYQAPDDPAIKLNTGVLSIEESVLQLFDAVLPRIRMVAGRSRSSTPDSAMMT
jgi:adenylylsulfate kinase